MRADLRNVVIVQDHGHINGGAAKVAIESALLLKERGLGVSFVAGSGPMDLRLVQAGIDCHVVDEVDIVTNENQREAALRGLWNAKAARLLEHHLDSLDPASTVIHLHAWTKALSPSVGQVVTRARHSHVCTLHEYFLACPNGAFYNYPKGEICRLRAMGPRCLSTQCDARSATHKAWRVLRQSLLWSKGQMPRGLRNVIYLSPGQRAVMESYFPEETKWHFLPNWVSGHWEDRVRVEENAAFLFVGRLSPEKGAVLAAEAARRANVPIIFAGEGPERARILEVNPKAKVLGWVSIERVSEEMARARCLLFPSLWYEGYPLVVADALRAGVPVLVSTNSVASSTVSDDLDGLHVASGDIDAWQAAIHRMQDAETARRLGQGAFQSGATLLNEDIYLDRLIDVYAQTLRRDRTAGSPWQTAARETRV